MTSLEWFAVVLTFPICLWVTAQISDRLEKVFFKAPPSDGAEHLWSMVTMAIFLLLEYFTIWLILLLNQKPT
jgi:hypothetical protein